MAWIIIGSVLGVTAASAGIMWYIFMRPNSLI